MEDNKTKATQMVIQDDGTLGEEPIDMLAAEQVDYNKLDVVDLARLCKEKDKAIESYEKERKDRQEIHNKEIENMNGYYVAKINELTALIRYYERKFKVLKDIILIEKEEEKDDSIQRTTKR